VKRRSKREEGGIATGKLEYGRSGHARNLRASSLTWVSAGGCCAG
jgi:hypothetical protein